MDNFLSTFSFHRLHQVRYLPVFECVLNVEYCIYHCGYVFHWTANDLVAMSDSLLDSDRTELLRVADPVDYSGHAAADFYFTDSAGVEGTKGEFSSQSAGASRPRSLPVDQQWPKQPSGQPPRNIFDDI